MMAFLFIIKQEPALEQYEIIRTRKTSIFRYIKLCSGCDNQIQMLNEESLVYIETY